MKIPFFVMSVLSLLSFEMSSQKDTLIYVGDPMCSWCYGFSPELDKVRAAFPDIPIKIVVGGLRAGGKETMADLGGFLHEHWTEVSDRTGQPFRYDILKQTHILYDTEPACRAVVTMGLLKPDAKYEFFKALQKSFYYDNDKPGVAATYVSIAKKFGVNEAAFKAKFESAEIIQLTRSEFELSHRMGVNGFPALLASIQGKLQVVTNGYAKADKIIAILKKKGL